ncbi:MAG TPA: hypothetical protein VHN14_12090 [Kofleriaceae bacterium]|jgi:hypothetical protein|nr:hypothetical protein [Kofleriaceae bacterium]
MKLSKLDRRDFIESMFLIGLTACAGPRAARRALGAAPPGESAIGPFFAELSRLSDDLARGRMTGRGFAHRAGARLMELELEADVLADWEDQGPVDPGIGHNGTRVIHKRDLRFGGRQRTTEAILFYTPAGVANPPHEHHNLISVKRVLKGSYHVRQYERVRRVEPGVIAIRQVSELADVNFDGPYVNMTDDRLNVHWFGAVGPEPVLALNIVVIGPLAPADTFHGARETRAPGQYYVDPTGVPGGDGLILAPAIGRERAEEFARQPLAAFPSRLASQETQS